jgi:hypothetical protein
VSIKDAIAFQELQRRVAVVAALVEQAVEEQAVQAGRLTALERRHLTKGQQAMLLAMAHPMPKRGVHSELGGLTGEFSKERLSLARTILRAGPDLARQVMAGTQPFDAALTEARERLQSAQVGQLREEAPDSVASPRFNQPPS